MENLHLKNLKHKQTVIGLYYSYFQYEAHRSETLRITCSNNIITDVDYYYH